MAGHSHWATIKRAKGAADAKRGKLFSKLSRYIIVAARHGGGDPDANLKLRYAIDKARAVSMPKDTIEKAIKKGTGELGDVTMDELSYEGYGPSGSGVAVMAEVLTDNRNRTNGEVRKIFEKAGGNMGSPGCVAYLFDRKGVIIVDATKVTEDVLMNVALDAGAEDLKNNGTTFEIICDVGIFTQVIDALQKANIETLSAEIAQVPKALVDVDVETGKRIYRMMEALDDHDDVQNVYSNANLTEEMMSE
jgi:YebC/PmpR family DNA-binding regulatory protein